MYRVYDKRALTEQIQRFLIGVEGNADAVAPTGMFDERTKKSVSNFQRKNQLEITGIVDEVTFELLYEQYLSEKLNKSIREKTSAFIIFPILPGSRSDGLIQIHRAMASLLDYYGQTHRIRESNYYNEETKKAINLLRKIYLLEEAEIIDEELYFRIMNDLNSINKPKYII